MDHLAPADIQRIQQFPLTFIGNTSDLSFLGNNVDVDIRHPSINVEIQIHQIEDGS